MGINIYIYREALLIEDVTDEIELIARRVFTGSRFERAGDDMWIHDNMTFLLFHDFIDNLTDIYGDEMPITVA